MDIKVKKRNGNFEPLAWEKVTKVLDWAAEGLDVSVSQVELNAKVQLYNGILTSDIHDMIIKSAADLISKETPDYQYMAARLLMFGLRKQAYSQYEPTPFYTHISRLIGLGKYDSHILKDYSKAEIDLLEMEIKHERDLEFAYAGAKQLEGKYLVQNRATGEVYESPQYAYMLIAMCLFATENKENRLDYVVRFYNLISTGKVSLPTPIMAGVRTPTRQFSSCVLIEADDSLDGIAAASTAIIKYVSQRAGIGINAGAIRALGSEIRGGEAVHTGLIPFFKMFQAAVKSCSQGGLRGGAATLFYPLWHLEVESLLVLKNNKGVEENRVRHMDYGVQINKLMYQRLIKGEKITLFSPHAIDGLYDAFFADQDKFEELYTAAENNPLVKKKQVDAVELFSALMQERANTGRIYIQNVDHCNTHGAFNPDVAPVKQSNLCVGGDTKVLTKNGHIEIKSLVGCDVDVWNGKQWSSVKVQKTGVNQKLFKVTADDGRSLVCTEYHKWYNSSGVELRTHELNIGDKLLKWKAPVIDGEFELKDAYTNGFYSGDGCQVRNRQRVYLYNDKRDLLDKLSKDYSLICEQPEQNRIYMDYNNLRHKFFVPDTSYGIKSRLDWLAGYLDADGCIYRNGSNEQITASSVNFEFLQEIQFMLQTLGVQAKIVSGQDAGLRKMPLNDGTGEYGYFECKQSWRLLVNSCDTLALQELGLKLNRLMLTKQQPQRNAAKFSRIASIEQVANGDTYCFNEPMEHKGVFNGILTGQCLEIALPTKPLKHIHDESGEIALCTLSAFNLGELESLDDFEEWADLAVRALDNLLDYQDYPVKAAEISTLARRSLGVGVINYAYYLAKNGLKYDESAVELTHKTFEAIQYYLLKASNKLAIEKGACDYFNQTQYAQGLTPVDTYKKDIDSYCKVKLQYDWTTLATEIGMFGLRNSTLTALMPSETSSQISNATNGIEPPRGLVTVKQSKDGILKQVVPEIGKVDYQLLWDMPNNDGYLKLVGVMQKFVDQSISANTNYDPSKFENGKVPMKQLIKDLLSAYKYGLKTLYYHNTRDGADDSQDNLDDGCAGGACKI